MVAFKNYPYCATSDNEEKVLSANKKSTFLVFAKWTAIIPPKDSP